MLICRNQTFSIRVRVVDKPDSSTLDLQITDYFIFALSHDFVSFVVLTLSHSTLLYCGQIAFIFRIKPEHLLKVGIMPHIRVDISTDDIVVVWKFCLECKQGLLHVRELKFIFVSF